MKMLLDCKFNYKKVESLLKKEYNYKIKILLIISYFIIIK
jgi:hypothetical protein